MRIDLLRNLVDANTARLRANEHYDNLEQEFRNAAYKEHPDSILGALYTTENYVVSMDPNNGCPGFHTSIRRIAKSFSLT